MAVPVKIVDLSPVLELVKFDGEKWINDDNGEAVGQPRYQEFGIVWEIGRLISQLEDNPFQ